MNHVRPHFGRPAPSLPAAPIRGFTLLELLVVMAILAVLLGLGVTMVPKMLGRGERSAVENVIMQLHSAIEAYSHDPMNGDYPPTMLDPDAFPGVGTLRNRENLGIESVMLCLNRKDHSSAFEVEDVPWPDAFENVDQDQTQVGLTNFGNGNRELYELLDRWGTPFAYFHHRDYDAVEGQGLGLISGRDGQPIKCQPYKQSNGMWARRNGFQIISAGPDGEFNTDDDVTNFEKE